MLTAPQAVTTVGKSNQSGVQPLNEGGEAIDAAQQVITKLQELRVNSLAIVESCSVRRKKNEMSSGDGQKKDIQDRRSALPKSSVSCLPAELTS